MRSFLQVTKYDLPIVDQLENKQFICKMNHDGMYRAEQFAAGSSLVIDPNHFDINELSRGDVVYYKTTATATEEEILSHYNKTSENPTGFIDGNEDSLTLEKEITIPDAHYILAGDVWWRSGFYNEPISKNNMRGRVVGWMKGNN